MLMTFARPVVLCVAAALACAVAFPAVSAMPREQGEDAKPLRVLVLTGGGHHDFVRNSASLLAGIREKSSREMIFTELKLATRQRDGENGPALQDDDLFTSHDVILAYHQGELGFTADVRERFLSYLRGGGGLVAIHSAADSHPGWDEYDRMLGGRFEHHPPFGEITVQVDVTQHPVTRNLPPQWTLTDEFYHLKNCAEDDKLILMRGRSPEDADDAPLRPVTWEKNYGAGRVFYTILGHGNETHADARFHQLISQAVEWAADAPKPNDDGYYVLFDGEEAHLAHWKMAGPGGFRFEDGEIVAHGGMGLYWYTERRFRDFTLELEYLTTRPEDNSGVFVRFMQPSDDPWYAVRHGHEIQICDAAGPKQRTGSVYAHADAERGPQASHGPGKWNRYEITVRGDEYTVVLNGEEILRWNSPTERHGREGYIGLQNHDDSSPIRFRNIRVRELRD